jgi:hypothetical protein
MSAAGGGAAAAAAAAAAKKRREREEEEKLTKYNSNDLDGWEFKIMRSAFGRFGNTEYFRKVCEQEARAGWELVEKFDNERVRFKRRVNKRANDQFLDFNAYRTSAGFGGGAGLIIGIISLIVGLLAAVFFFAYSTGYRIEVSSAFIPYAVLGLLVLIAIVSLILRKRSG